MEPLQEQELILLAKDVPHTKFAELCTALGYSYARAQSILATRLNNYSMAMQDILIDWKTVQTDAIQSRSVLASKLRETGLGTHNDKLSKGAYQPKPCDPLNKETTPLQSSSDIYNKKISESLSVEQCRKKLKGKYLNSLCKIKMAPWDPNKYAEFKDMHTVVTMVKKDAYGKATGIKEILQGSVDEIFSTEVNGNLPVRILISAPAGRGKTTAVAKMAYDWANRVPGSSLENLPLLFVVKLRNTNKQTSIAEAIRSQLLSDVAGLTEEGLHKFIAENQNICHIILDGLDEYAGLAANQGFRSNIVNVMLCEELKNCRVLVTTRPHLESFFSKGELPMVYTKMWIEGFSRESSREYIDKFFVSISNPSRGQCLKNYLNEQPLINELVITPLFCLMVCHLWSESLLENTTTQTELLDSVNVFLMHHANARLNSNYPITNDELGKIICKLGRIALSGLLDDAKKLVFTLHDFRRGLDILEKACELGILSKTTTQLTGLPQSHVTSSTTIEFYHKLAQEHSAGKYLADQTNKYLLWLKISKLDRVLRKIRSHIGDYENLIRFAAGTKNSLCIRIMEALLANRVLDESERYRILFDCSSETKGTEQAVSSLVQRCVAAQRILLKSPTIYTVVGIQNLPVQLKKQVRQVRLEGSAISVDVTDGLWSCLESFSTLHTVTILDSSLSFSLSPLILPSVKKLEAERVTSQSYERMISSMPNLKEIDVTIDDDVEGNKSQITASRPPSQSGDQHFPVHIKLQALPSLSRDQKSESRETVAELSLLIGEQIKNRQWLQVSGVKGQDEEALVNLFFRTSHLKTVDLEFSRSLNSDRRALNIHALTIKHCKLIDQMTASIWSFLESVTSPVELNIADSSLSFSPSLPHDLQSVRKLIAKRVTSHSYEGLVSSLPAVEEIEVSVDDAERDIPHITAGLCQTGGRQLTRIALEAPTSLQLEKKEVTRETMRGLGVLIEGQTNKLQMLAVAGMRGGNEEDLVALIECCRRAKALNCLLLIGCGSKRGGRLESYAKDVISKERLRVLISHEMNQLAIDKFQLSTEMTIGLWSSLRFFTSVSQISISDSSLKFPLFPPELPSVTKLTAKRVTSHSYKGLLSSVPNMKEIDITVENAKKQDLSRIQASLRQHLTGEELTLVRLDRPHSFPSEESVSGMSREMMRGLGLLASDRAFHEATLSRVICGPKETVIDLVRSSTRVMSSSLYSEQFSESLNSNKNNLNMHCLTMRNCKLTAMVTSTMWSCLRSFPSLDSLTITDSSLSFLPSPPELTSVTKLKTERVTSQSYEGLLPSIPGVKEIDITVGNAEKEDLSSLQASLRRNLTGHELTVIRLDGPPSQPPEESVSGMSRETMRGLGLLTSDRAFRKVKLSGVICGPVKTVIDFVQSSTRSMSSSLYTKQFSESLNSDRNASNISSLMIRDCRLTAIMITSSMWSCLRNFTSLSSLTISDSSLSFSPSPPELTSVTQLEAKRVTSQSYEGLLSSLPGLQVIDITIDNARRDISQITAGLRHTGGQQLTRIALEAPDSLSPEKKSVSRETMRGLGLLIKEQTKNLKRLTLTRVKCTHEEDLIYLIECCRHVKAMENISLKECRTKEGGRLESHLKSFHSSRNGLEVWVSHENAWWSKELIPFIS